MDSLIAAAALALSAGDPLAALNRIALREDPPALALRGIAMAQLGDLTRAKLLLRRAARGFGDNEAVARARCIVALAEVALAARDLGGTTRALEAAVRTLERGGDRANAVHGRLLAVRRLLLLGRVADAERALASLDLRGAPPQLVAMAELAAAELALRSVHARTARAALVRARRAAEHARIPALLAEVTQAHGALEATAARAICAGRAQLLRLEQVEDVIASSDLVVDGCRRTLRAGGAAVTLARRPVLFALLRALAEAWPGDVARDALVACVFQGRHADASHRARLRVEAGRLRKELRSAADIQATPRGFALVPRAGRRVVVLAPPDETADSPLLALLGDGERWSTSALALALGASQRHVQRTLQALAHAGQVESFGRGRAQRWLARPVAGFTTALLLPAPMPIG
jgi:DNA-binding winged helix-turn-helix (wHTH) protein